MKKKRITYGVYGMMEYQSIIKIGRATLKVLFSDGSMTAFGQNPAKYTTSDFLVQRAIENSSDFKRGRITVVNAIELDEEVRIERNPAKKETVKVANTEAGSTAEETATGTDGEQTATKGVAEATAKEETPADETAASTDEAEAESEASTSTTDGATEVEFTTNQEAKDYLSNTFGVTTAFRNRAEIVACGATYGVKITFANEK